MAVGPLGLPSASVASGFQVCFLLKQPCNNMTAYSNNKATWQVAMYDSFRDGYACCPVSSVPVMVRRRGRSGLCGLCGRLCLLPCQQCPRHGEAKGVKSFWAVKSF